ncbi:hypothetical protein LQL77_31540 [Rhodococcus cerastii]|nr:hypothetical protein [Rhodococcus cerastii]
MNLHRHVTILGITAFGAVAFLAAGVAQASPAPDRASGAQQALPKWFLEAAISTNNRCDPPEVIDAHTVELPCNAEFDVWVNNRHNAGNSAPIDATVQAVVTGPDGLRAETFNADSTNNAPIEWATLHQGAERKFDFAGNGRQGISLHVKSLSSPEFPDELVKVIVTG